ncbi:MAG: cytochrome C [Blastomonas sp. CACIA14H2]|jgi:cytochrome c|uniref:c-type cytochrome n=1 Tax=unclassified Blastomonas TaxID=2626550 RepID=UPI0003CFFD09|nr:c-type cytochrome [Blastomonas sp. UPD001]ESZ86958.1 MAG: cytochrome C [Blastomonas sp. CACIA14H2]
MRDFKGRSALAMGLSFVLAVIAGTSAIMATASGATPAPPAGDATRGAQVYEDNCTGCHSLDANRVGPAHRGVFGRKAGSAPGFAYSPALKKAKFAWDAARLDKWLTNPQGFVPGAKMGFRLSDAQKRADVIAYLKKESGK